MTLKSHDSLSFSCVFASVDAPSLTTLIGSDRVPQLHKLLHTKNRSMSDSLKRSKTKTRAIENLSARVYNQIKNLILCNEIMPGQKLHHQQLSERLGVSRTPVREALTRLVQEGYVSFLPNRGFTCKEIRMQEAEELYELREALEAFAVEKAIANLTDAALARLRAKMNSYGRDVQNRFTRERLVFDQDVHLADRRARRQRNFDEHAEPRVRAHRAQAPDRRTVRSGPRAGRAPGTFTGARGDRTPRCRRSCRRSAQPHSSRQKKRHDRSPTAASDSRTPSY